VLNWALEHIGSDVAGNWQSATNVVRLFAAPPEDSPARELGRYVQHRRATGPVDAHKACVSNSTHEVTAVSPIGQMEPTAAVRHRMQAQCRCFSMSREFRVRSYARNLLSHIYAA